MTARDALREGAAALAGTQTPLLDASLLLAAALGIDSASLLASGPEGLAESPLAAYRESVRSRSRGLPVAYILGYKEFWGRRFAVDPRVLIPRPDTETLVEAALKLGDAISRDGVLRVHECCTGSGCVAISVARERPDWEVSASDLSDGALEVAAINAASLIAPGRPGGPVTFARSDLLASVDGEFDLVLANPPYVGSAETTALLGQGWSEPRLALDGGPDGLAAMRRLVPEAAAALVPGGGLLVEADPSQAQAVAELFRGSRLTGLELLRDLSGAARVTSGEESVDDLKTGFLARSAEAYVEADGRRIADALAWTEERHSGRLRASGEGAWVHDLRVADTLLGLGLDADSVVAGLLHDALDGSVPEGALEEAELEEGAEAAEAPAAGARRAGEPCRRKPRRMRRPPAGSRSSR